jgi:hypothetical protein
VRQNVEPLLDAPVRTVERHEAAQRRAASAAPQANIRPTGGIRRSTLHVHWFRWLSEDSFGNGSLHACRCGVVKHSL